MKRLKIQCVIIALIVSVVTLGCGKSIIDEIASPKLLSFSLTVGNSTFSGAIDENEHTIVFGGIEKGYEITRMSYVLSMGATISPNPEELIGKWKEEEQFTVTSTNGESLVYTVILSDFVENKTNTSFKVVGYIRPNGFSDLDKMDLSRTTHINLSFANLNSNGQLEFGQDFTSIVSKLKAKDINVLMAIGGGGVEGIKGEYWHTYLASDKRKETILGIVNFVELHNLDGIDIDFENAFLLSLGDYYNLFVTELKVALHEKGKIITAALNSGSLKSNVTIEAVKSFDYINVMAYDNTGPWRINDPGQHSPLSEVETVIDFWVKGKGIPSEKIVFGLPFYGYDFSRFDQYPWGLTWTKIVNEDPTNAYVDQVGQLWYNGIPTIAKKTHLALEKFGGVMVWSYGMDVFDDMSLLKVINQVVDAGFRGAEVINTYYADEDGDGYGSLYKPFQAYEQPKGYVNNRNDSDDTDKMIHP